MKTGRAMTAPEIAEALNADPQDVFRLMLHLCSNDPDLTVTYDDDDVTLSKFSKK